jgi:hypothetical protein
MKFLNGCLWQRQERDVTKLGTHTGVSNEMKKETLKMELEDT